ncbi:MAG TPA: hypothetical protein VF163_05200, partial [Micromonosporaceae bacterium]
MTTPVENMLRERLPALADVPGPASVADAALARAARMRRRRIVLASAGAAVLAGAVAIPLVGYGTGAAPPGGPPLGVGTAGGSSCKTVTDETDPAQGVPRDAWPDFVAVTVAKLPPRDDYTLQSGYGVCPLPP